MQLAAPYDDLQQLAALCRGLRCRSPSSSRIFPPHAIAHLAEHVPVRPGAHALAMTQDRLTRKNLCRKAGPEDRAFFRSVIGRRRRARLSRKLGGTAILKTRRFGYDGKGQAKVTSADEAAKAFDSFKGAPSILEGFVDFSFEASVVAARGADGAFAAYDPPENEHENHILRRSTVPSRLSAAQSRRSQGHRQEDRRCAGLCRRAGGGIVRGPGRRAAGQ